MYSLKCHLNNVFDFMFKGKQNVQLSPSEPTLEDRILRARLIMEEAMETVDALGVDMFTDDIYSLTIKNITFTRSATGYDEVKFLDGMLDSSVVNLAGGAAMAGFQPDLICEALKAVDNNNLTKVKNPVWDDNGKIIKPDDYVSVTEELKAILAKYKLQDGESN